MNKKNYEKSVKKLNCRYAKKKGICSLHSGDEKDYCLLGPCLDFKPKYSKRKQRKINRICERNNIIKEKIIKFQNNFIVCSPSDVGRVGCGKTKEL